MIKQARTINLDDCFLFVHSQKDVQENLIRLNKEQLGRGEDALNQSLGLYSNVSLDLFDKPTRGNPFLQGSGDEIRLYDTGDFYRSIAIASVTKKMLLLDSDSVKQGGTDLGEVYGAIIGLNTKGMEEHIVFITPKTQEYIRQWLLR